MFTLFTGIFYPNAYITPNSGMVFAIPHLSEVSMRSYLLFATLLASSFTMANVGFNAQSSTLVINASGSDGSNGSDASNNSWRKGHNGNRGEDGQDAGNVKLSLSYADANKTRVNVAVQIPERDVNFNQTFSLAELKNITIDASGGDGGNGGSGGEGGDGSDGSDGMSGCSPSSGSRGSDGYKGGTGGDAGEGGNAGNVFVNVSEDQSELLMLVRSLKNDRGDSGRPGEGGPGGDGGDGGDGGRNTCEDGGSDASDGWDGSDGSRGDSGQMASDGRSANKGYVVAGAQVVTYPEKFNLQVRGLVYEDENNDGIIEYGEKINITKISLINTSSMPTPPNTQIIGLTNAIPHWKWITNKPSLTVASIGQNQTVDVAFPVGDLSLQAMDIAQFTDTNTGFPVTFAKGQLIGNFQAYPNASIKRIAVLNSTKAKEDMFWMDSKILSLAVVNQGRLNIGGNSYRPLSLAVKMSSKIATSEDIRLKYGEQLIPLDKGGKGIIPLQDLAPGKNLLALKVTLGERQDLYSDINFEFTLMKRPKDAQQLLPIDRQATAIGAAKDLIKDAYSFKIPLKDKMYCHFGPKEKKRRVKEISITKLANDPKVSLNMNVSFLLLFKTKIPTITQERHQLALHLADLNSNQMVGEKMLGFLNSYVAPGSKSTFTTPQTADKVISRCVQKVKK